MEIRTDETSYHYWMPVPQDRRHAFRGARRWDGRRSGKTVCGIEVALAAPSELDWIHIATCPACWDSLVTEAGVEQPERDTGTAPRR